MTQNTFHGKIDRNVVTIGRKNMGKKTDKSTVGLILGFVKRMQEDHIGAYAAQAAYFLIMSFIPFVLVLTALVQYTPLTYRMLRQVIIGFVPDNLQDFVLKIIAEVFSKSAAVVPISGLFALWSSGKGMQSLIAGLERDLSRKGDSKLADEPVVFDVIYVFVYYCNYHQSSSSGYG